MSETKRGAHPEIWILLLMGVKPQTLIDKGFSRGTVYKYNGQIPELRKRLDTLQQMKTG